MPCQSQSDSYTAFALRKIQGKRKKILVMRN